MERLEMAGIKNVGFSTIHVGVWLCHKWGLAQLSPEAAQGIIMA
jgi:hypothetical protein